MTTTALATRLPYDTSLQEQFGVDVATWKVLTEAIWPEAQSPASIILAMSYCKARNLDPLKRVVHIVPVWSSSQRKMVDTIWPSICELRTTATRTKSYAGHDRTEFGPDVTREWQTEKGPITVVYPEWAQVTVHKIVGGQRVPFAGPQVYWDETYARVKDGSPNSMWQRRPRGQLDKCATAAALREAFPEETGDDFTEADGPGLYQHIDATALPASQPIQQPQRLPEPPEEPPVAPPEESSDPTPQPASECEMQIHLCAACIQIAEAHKCVVTDDAEHFKLSTPPDGINKGNLVADICATLSSWFCNGKVKAGESDPDKLNGFPLQRALANAKRAVAALGTA